MARSFAFVVCLGTLLDITLAQKCYGLNGTELDSTFGPCNSTAKFSGCCAIYRPAGSVDVCLDNGLCMATNEGYMGAIFQAGCTDPTGRDPSCPKFCPDVRDNFGGLKPVLNWNIQMCDYGSYCCRSGTDSLNCCDNPAAPKILTSSIGSFKFQTSTAPPASATATASSKSSAVAATLTTPSSSQPTQVVGTAVSTGVPFTTATASPSEQCAAEKHKTAVVGGALGGILGTALVAACVVIFFLYQREKHQRKMKEHYEEQFEISNKYWPREATSRPGTSGTMMTRIAGPVTPSEKEPDVARS